MSIIDVLRSLRRRWYFILAAVIVGGSVGVAAFSLTTPTYQASATVYFSVPVVSSAGELAQGGNYTQEQLASYSALATEPIVLRPVISRLGLRTDPEMLAKQVSATASTDTVLTSVAVTDTDPGRAARVANAIAKQLGETVKDLSPKAANGSSAIDYAISGEAVPPKHPTAPNKKLDLGAGLLGGLMLGLIAALARDRLDTRIWGEDDVVGTPTLAKIPIEKSATKRNRSPVISDWVEGSARAEAFRRLRTALQFVDVDHADRILTVTSSLAGEGKSGTASNLAVGFAEAGHRVLLIDADLRRPSIADYFGLDGTVGLTNVLAGQAEVDDALQQWGDRRQLSILVAGSIPPNPSELLGSERMARLLDRFRAEYDVVLIDTPPVLLVTDAAVISAAADGAVLVARYGHSRRADLAESLEALRAAETRVVGTVLNRVRLPKRGYGRGYYGSVTTPQSQTAAPTIVPTDRAKGTQDGSHGPEPTDEPAHAADSLVTRGQVDESAHRPHQRMLTSH